MVKAEFHVHTRFSHDSLLPLWLLYVMCRLRGVQSIAITDHNVIEGAVRFKARYLDLFVIVGEEINTAQGEIIGLFLNKKIPAGLTARETVDLIREQGGMVYVPHPYDTKRRRTVLSEEALSKISDSIEWIETYNGRTVCAEDILKQKEIAARYELPTIVGSDAHTFFEIGRTYLNLVLPITNRDSFIEGISSADVYTSPCHRLAHLATKIVRGLKLLFTGQVRLLVKKIRPKK